MLANTSYLLTNAQASAFVVGIEVLLGQAVFFLEVILEFIAILIIAFAVLITLQKLLKRMIRAKNYEPWEFIRLEFALVLALSLEFLLAADIVSTAFSPSWDAIGKLGAVTGIRTFLNFFLQKEVQELEFKARLTNNKSEQDVKLDIWQKPSVARVISKRK